MDTEYARMESSPLLDPTIEYDSDDMMLPASYYLRSCTMLWCICKWKDRVLRKISPKTNRKSNHTQRRRPRVHSSSCALYHSLKLILPDTIPVQCSITFLLQPVTFYLLSFSLIAHRFSVLAIDPFCSDQILLLFYFVFFLVWDFLWFSLIRSQSYYTGLWRLLAKQWQRRLSVLRTSTVVSKRERKAEREIRRTSWSKRKKCKNKNTKEMGQRGKAQ